MSYRDDMIKVIDAEIARLTKALGEAEALRELITEGEGVQPVAAATPKPPAPSEPKRQAAKPLTVPERMRQILKEFDPDRPKTTKEVADAVGLSDERARTLVRELQDAGRLRCTEPSKTKPNGSGGKTPAYYVRVPILNDKKEEVIVWP